MGNSVLFLACNTGAMFTPKRGGSSSFFTPLFCLFIGSCFFHVLVFLAYRIDMYVPKRPHSVH